MSLLRMAYMIKATNGLGIHLCFHVLADRLLGPRAQENDLGNLFSRFIFCQ